MSQPSVVQPFVFENGVEYIKIHGLQRTATNYAAYLINENYVSVKALVNAGGWKHGYYCAPWTLGREVHIVAVLKNPYAWLVSLYVYWRNNPVGMDLTNISFADFVRSPVILEEQAGAPFLYRTANPVQHWNSLNFHWSTIRTNSKKLCLLPMEAMISDPEWVVDEIGNHFGLRRKGPKAITTNKVVAPGGENPSPIEQDFNRDYYVNRSYMREYDDGLLAFVNEQLDDAVLAATGYQKETR